jgi:hypothetical protein
MSGLPNLDAADPTRAYYHAQQVIDTTTSRFPVSQVIWHLSDLFDWLLDEVSTKEYWLQKLDTCRQQYRPKWESIAERALGQQPRRISNQALRDPEFDPLNGSEPWGQELTQALRAVLADLEELGEEAIGALPSNDRARAFARAVRTQTGNQVVAVCSYAPLRDSEWRAILDQINGLIHLALRFEGAVLAWLIGGFARDPEGRLQLRPQVSLSPPPSGTRVKPLRVMLGTAYEEQCPSLIPVMRAAEGAEPRPSDLILTGTRWHRLVIQLDVPVDDYVLLNLERLRHTEREITRQVMYLDQRPRPPQVVEGAVRAVPRPWQGTGLPEDLGAMDTMLLPRPDMVAQASTEVSAPDGATLRQDAEQLRQKGMSAIDRDPALAQKYLLASTILENSSVDVWLMLVDIASNEKQRASFRREAEKVLQRQRQGQ